MHTRFIPRPPNGSNPIKTDHWDRKKLSAQTYSYHGTGAKFVKNFLADTGGIDLWRHLHPYDEKFPGNGHTCFNNQGKSSARLDYFLISKELLQNSEKTQMLLGEWYRKASDHVRLTCRLRLKSTPIPPTVPKRVVAIHKPNISALPPEEQTLLKETLGRQLQSLLNESQVVSMEEADQLSIRTAKLIVDTALQTRCTQMKERKEKSQYIACVNERLKQ